MHLSAQELEIHAGQRVAPGVRLLQPLDVDQDRWISRIERASARGFPREGSDPRTVNGGNIKAMNFVHDGSFLLRNG